jgi:hypothetical protein
MIDEYICANDISGHRVGTCYVSSNYPIVYIPITKNAHTWATSYFSDILHWQMKHDECMRVYDSLAWHINSTIQYHKKIVILRNPIGRWMSGIVQYFYTHFDDDVEITDHIINYLFSKIHFDEHTLPQINFLHNLELASIDFFDMDDNLEVKLNDYLKNQITNEYVPIPITLHKNKTSSKMIQDKKLYAIIRKNVTYNRNLRQKIHDFYKQDYELLESIKFYGSN